MTSTSTDIPEILLLISAHLDFKHIVPCTLVNKAWYAAFAHLRFKEINASNAKSIALERYCAHATLLRISMKSPIFNVIASKCTLLTELQVRGPGSSTTTLSKKWINFLQNNPRITKVIALELTPRSLTVLVEHCPKLQELVVRGFEFGYWNQGSRTQSSFVSPLWSIAQGLTSLDLGFNSYTVHANVLLDCPDPDGLPLMRHLVLRASYSSLTEYAKLIRAAKNLETLTWNFEHIRLEPSALQTFRQVFASLPHLRELRLVLPVKQIFLGRAELTEFLMLLPPCVKEFEVRAYALWATTDDMIQGPLSRQFHALETLDLSGWQLGSIVDVILRSCPLLRNFHCYALRANLTDETTGTSGAFGGSDVDHCGVGPLGWICIGLETLGVRFVECTDAMRRPLFDQLCCMKQLTTVDIGGLNPADLQWDEGETPRRWRNQTIEKDEITGISWMREMWPRLERFHTYGETLSPS